MSTIRDRILARPDLAAARAARDLSALAAGLNEQPEFVMRECWVDALGIVNRCASGKSILRKLKAGTALDAIIDMAWQSLVSGKGLDFGAASTLDSVDEMAGPLEFTEAEVRELKTLALLPIYVTREQIEAELYNRDTTEK